MEGPLKNIYMTFLSNSKNITFSSQSAPALRTSYIRKDKKVLDELNDKLFGKTKDQQQEILQETLEYNSTGEVYNILRNLKKNPYEIDFTSPYNKFLNTILEKSITLLKNEEEKGGKNLKKLLHFVKLFKNIDKETIDKIFSEVKEEIKKLDIRDFIIATTNNESPASIHYIGNTKIIAVTKENLLASNSKYITFILGHEIAHSLLWASPTYNKFRLNFVDTSKEIKKLGTIRRKERVAINLILSKKSHIKENLLKTKDEVKFLNLLKKIDRLNDKLNKLSKISIYTRKKIDKINKNLKSNHFEELLCDQVGVLVTSLFLDNKKSRKAQNIFPDVNIVTKDKNTIYTHPKENVRNALINVSFRKLTQKKRITHDIFKEYDKKLKLISRQVVKKEPLQPYHLGNKKFLNTFKDYIVDTSNDFSYFKTLKYLSILDEKLKSSPCIINKKYLKDTYCYENLNRFFQEASEILKYNDSKLQVNDKNKNNILRICENGGLGILLIVDKKNYFQDRILKRAQNSSELIENLNYYLNYNRESFIANKVYKSELVCFNVTQNNLHLCVNLLKSSIKLNLSENYILNLFDKPGLIVEAIYNECEKRQNFSLFNKIQKNYRY